MKKHYVGLNLLDRVMKADSIKDMLRLIKPYLDKERFAMLKRAIRTHKDERGRRDCIIRYAEEIVRGKQ